MSNKYWPEERISPKTVNQLKLTHLVCRKCKETFPKIDEFFEINKKALHYKKGIITHRTICRKCSYQIERASWLKEPIRYIRMIVGRAKFRALHKKGIPFEITAEDVLDLYNKQNGKCAITGLEITIGTKENKITLPTALSIDQKIPSKGYTIDNVQLVCFWANMAKGTLSQEDFIEMCRKVVDTNNNCN